MQNDKMTFGGHLEVLRQMLFRTLSVSTLTLVMGIVFQLPVISYALGKMGFINATMLSEYRKHSFITIMFIAAVITPPDLMTLALVTIPLYLL